MVLNLRERLEALVDDSEYTGVSSLSVLISGVILTLVLFLQMGVSGLSQN